MAQSFTENSKSRFNSGIQFLLHRGVSFCDVSLVDSDGKAIKSARWLYSKHKFKPQIEAFLASHADKVKSVVLLDEFADRLSGLRLGGSVAAVFPKGLEKLTAHIQESPIHSESVVLAEPASWSDEWKTETLELIKQNSIKRIAWQCSAPAEVLNFFAENGFENFVTEKLSPSPLLNWRRNLLNASCSGPILELTEEVQLALKNLKIEAPLFWLDEDLSIKEKTNNRYGLTSTWTHLVGLWAEKKWKKKLDIFVLDWDGCFHIGQKESTRWTPWGPVSTPSPLPAVQLFSLQPTQTLEKNIFGEWDCTGKVDYFEPGPVFLGRGLKPTTLDIILEKPLLETQFEIKTDCTDKLNRQMASQMGLKNNDEIQKAKQDLKMRATKKWAQDLVMMSQTGHWLLLGPLAELVQSELKNLKLASLQSVPQIPSLHELFQQLDQND